MDGSVAPSPASARLVFFGNERLATGLSTDLSILRGLIAAGYTIAAIVVGQEDGRSSRKTRPLEIAALAQEHGIPVLAPGKLSDIQDELAAYQAEAGVLAAYGKLVPQSVIDIFPAGIVNIHPSLLPRHRGSIPIEGAILQGDSETGVSLMQLVSKMDAGPVYAQETVLLNGQETKQQLANQLAELGRDMLVQYLPAILTRSLTPSPQDDAAATYDSRLKKEDGIIEIDGWMQPAIVLERKVRALAGWPRVRTTLGTTEMIITAAHVREGEGEPGTLWIDGKQLGIHCQDGILVIDSLIPAGRKEMTAAAYLAGYKPPTDN
ncbi:MAG: fmt, methionyl-tRNA formyltransferase [Candidatus Saccharibacteria bacterium]|nr:fmt, methionyl-tRNA formyltransferase [Candidatus Saccharibacteria bacterium]